MTWIKCSDSLPKKGQSAAFTFDGENIENRNFFNHLLQHWSYEHEMGWICRCKNKITHWIPYPEKP